MVGSSSYKVHARSTRGEKALRLRMIDAGTSTGYRVLLRDSQQEGFDKGEKGCAHRNRRCA